MPIGPGLSLLERLFGMQDTDMNLPMTQEPDMFAATRIPQGPPIESDMADIIMRGPLQKMKPIPYEPMPYAKLTKKKKYAKTLKKYGQDND